MIHPILLNSLQFLLPWLKVIVLFVVSLCIFISYLLTGGKKDGNIRYC